jgi:regulatory protein
MASESALSLSQARDLAARKLALREHSAQEIDEYLRRKGVRPEDAATVVAEFIRGRLIDDERFAALVIKSQTRRGKGPVFIRQKLMQKGVRLSLEQVRSVLGDVADEPSASVARRVIERRYPRYRDDKKEAGRAFQALIRRGFSYETAREAVFGKADPS